RAVAPFTGVHHQVATAAAAPNAEQHAVAFDFPAALHRFVGAVDALAIDFENDIARTQPRRSRRRSVIHVHHERALNLIGNVELPAITGVGVLDDDAVKCIGLRAARQSTGTSSGFWPNLPWAVHPVS